MLLHLRSNQLINNIIIYVIAHIINHCSVFHGNVQVYIKNSSSMMCVSYVSESYLTSLPASKTASWPESGFPEIFPPKILLKIL